MAHFTTANSVDKPSGDAFTGTGPDTLIVDANAFLISESGGNGARLSGSWTVTINGTVAGFGSLRNGLSVSALSIADVSNVKIGKTGDIFGDRFGVSVDQAGILTNRGSVSGGSLGIEVDGTGNGILTIKNFGSIESNDHAVSLNAGIVNLFNTGTIKGAAGQLSIFGGGETHITNSGTLIGDVLLGSVDDTFSNFAKVGKIIKSGFVAGEIDLGGGADLFIGGANSETVRDGGGSDIFKLGGGNDIYLAAKNGGVDGADIVSGGKGIDTYDASGGSSQTINLNEHFAAGGVGNDTFTGFENVIGGNGGDSLIGSDGANRLTSGTGEDIFDGLGGRDILTGGAGADTFRLFALSDSGTKAASRDFITDFTQGAPGVGDVIDLSAIDAKLGAGNPGDDDFTFIGVHSFSGTKGELRGSYSGGNTIVSGDVNGDGKADFSIAIKGHVSLADTDFVL